MVVVVTVKSIIMPTIDGIILTFVCDDHYHNLIGANLSEPHINGTAMREFYIIITVESRDYAPLCAC